MDFILRILGTASAMPTSGRYPSAHVLEVHGRFFLIDCGEGTQMQLRRVGVSFLKIDTICISHLHGDHMFGFFGLVSTMSMLGRTAPLHVYAPGAFADVISFYRKCFGDIRFEIDLHILDMKAPEIVFDSRNTEIVAFPLKHRIETYGFIIREKIPPLNVRKEFIPRYSLTLSEIGALKRGEDVVREPGEFAEPSSANGFRMFSGTSEPLVIPVSEATYRPYEPRSYAYCSDTAPFPELSSWVSGVDLLYHESTYTEDLADRAEQTFHSTAADAARCALEAGAGRLLLGHYSSRFHDLGPFLDEASAIFSHTSLARECDVITLPMKKQENC